jgi:shikimate 5-dehydrogenase
MQTGAINTVAIAPDGRTTGYNFDRPGWRSSFAESLVATARKGRSWCRSAPVARGTPLRLR